MRSMTGFGQASGANARHEVAVALRGVNHRFLDLALRLREEYRTSEAELRERLAADLHRGRVEAAVEVTPLQPRHAGVSVDAAVVEALHAASRDLAARGLLVPTLTLGDLARLPEVVRVEIAADAWDDADHRLLLTVAGEALAQFVAARRREGDRLRQLLATRLDELRGIVARLGSRREVVARDLGEALRRRLLELTAGQEIDPTRLAQEAAMLVDRSDIREELDRLATHLDHFDAVAAERGAVGKRLDFLTQEIFRELNTLGAKSRDGEMIRWALDAKVVCEQLREQVQNVE